MSRIRSIHPGFFTDEDLVSVSVSARLLFLGLGVEADDKGMFEWKPLTIKMRIFPADNVDVPALLGELVGANAICPYEIDGRKFGAIRNFRKFQRPKTPNDIHPSTADIRNYVGLPDANSEPFPRKGEKAPQMEDGGGKMEVGKSDADASAAAPATPVEPVDPEKVMFDQGRRLLADAGILNGKAGGILGKWKRDHGAEAVIVALGKAQREGAIDPISFIEGCFRNGKRPHQDRPSGPIESRRRFREQHDVEPDLGYGPG
jgi:hypothetical protein